MSDVDDLGGEMYRDSDFDETSAEQLLRGRIPAGCPELAPIADLMAQLRATAGGRPFQPTAALAAVLADGGSPTPQAIDKGDLPATAASNATGPARRTSGLPKWRKTMIGSLFSAILAKSAVAQAATALTVAATVTAGAGVAGALPAPAQQRFAAGVAAVTPFEVPDGASHDDEPSAPQDPVVSAPSNEDDAEEAREAAEDARERAEEKAREEREEAEEKAREAEEEKREKAEDEAEDRDDDSDDRDDDSDDEGDEDDDSDDRDDDSDDEGDEDDDSEDEDDDEDDEESGDD